MTRQAPGSATTGSLPLEALPDIRAILARCRAEGTVLDGSEMVQIIPSSTRAPARAYGQA